MLSRPVLIKHNTGTTARYYYPILISTLLVLCFFIQYIYNWSPDWITKFQSNMMYKQLTGFLLLFYLFIQWQLAVPKDHSPKLTTLNRFRHKHLGMYAPVLLFIHSVEFGYAFQVFLNGLFLANCIIGSLGPTIIGVKNKTYYSIWLYTHISLAVGTLALLTFHIYVTYTY